MQCIAKGTAMVLSNHKFLDSIFVVSVVIVLRQHHTFCIGFYFFSAFLLLFCLFGVIFYVTET